MGKSQRCLYESHISSFLRKEADSILGAIDKNYHGDALTTTREAWIGEIEILQRVLLPWDGSDGRIVF